MPWYRDVIYPHLVNLLSDPAPIRAVRHQIIPLAEGMVLEVGVGAGANLVHYDPTRVQKLYALEPNRDMIRLAERRVSPANLEVEFLEAGGERIPLDDSAIDTVVSTFTLCTIPEVAQALIEIRRVLRPNGRFIFFELTLAPDLKVQGWQRRWEPIQRRIFAGLALTRNIPQLLVRSGFEIERLHMQYLARIPKSWAHCCWGVAVPPPISK